MRSARALSSRAWIIGSTLVMVVVTCVATVWIVPGREAATGQAESAAGGVSRTLVWIDRQGHRSWLPVPARGYVYPRLSPDGRRIAVDIRDREHGIWIWDLAAQTLAAFSTGRASDISPVWTADGGSIVFARGRASAPAVLRKAADGSGHAESLPVVTNSLLMPTSLSPDADRLVVTASVASGFDLQLLRLGGPGLPEPLVSTDFDELNGEISPDGQWLAYQSRQSGQFEIRVQRFDTTAPRASLPSPAAPPAPRAWRVSGDGGTRPVWSRNGRELFYLTVNGQMMTVPVSHGEDFSFGAATELFRAPIYADLVGRTYDVSPDGQRFLAVMELARTQ